MKLITVIFSSLVIFYSLAAPSAVASANLIDTDRELAQLAHEFQSHMGEISAIIDQADRPEAQFMTPEARKAMQKDFEMLISKNEKLLLALQKRIQDLTVRSSESYYASGLTLWAIRQWPQLLVWSAALAFAHGNGWIYLGATAVSAANALVAAVYGEEEIDRKNYFVTREVHFMGMVPLIRKYLGNLQFDREIAAASSRLARSMGVPVVPNDWRLTLQNIFRQLGEYRVAGCSAAFSQGPGATPENPPELGSPSGPEATDTLARSNPWPGRFLLIQ